MASEKEWLQRVGETFLREEEQKEERDYQLKGRFK